MRLFTDFSFKLEVVVACLALLLCMWDAPRPNFEHAGRLSLQFFSVVTGIISRYTPHEFLYAAFNPSLAVMLTFDVTNV
jgi:hypothetical protein